ncbi:MAG: hypothetical protein L0Y58_05730 [Verrucomicrobia subdivision 3 bacterium]|nr:hypothetical protein [Limisphaerales bacterium]
MAKSRYAAAVGAEQLRRRSGGYPILSLYDHGFELDLKRHSRKIREREKAAEIFTAAELQSIEVICDAIADQNRVPAAIADVVGLLFASAARKRGAQ